MEGREEQALCINCNIAMTSVATQNKFLVLEQNTRVISCISNWISPVIVTEEDYICEACFGLVVQAVNAELHQNNDRCAGPPRRGHTEVCLVCGRSLTKRQSHQILHVTSHHQCEIVQMVQDTIAPREEVKQLEDFVPRNLGLNHKTREETLQHNLLIPNGLHNEDNLQCVIICDGTYIYLNKSSNYMFQKDSYSLHKYRNLLKPFMLVLCDGYILDCFGPFKATTSDADIMKHLFQNEDSPLRQYFCANDVFILDRGFRDCIDMLRNECNYQVHVPESLLEGEHQLTTIQANRSRCVTICRWVVEVVNGYFKRDFRLLRFDYFNKTTLNMMIYFQIAAALINKFGVRLHDRIDAAQILSIIRERMFFENNLSIAVNALNMNRRASSFRNITAGDGEILFPRLEYTDLILFALGTYQIRQARSYYGEHIRFHGGYRIEVCREIMNIQEFNLRGSGENSLIRGKIKSRHVGRRQYYIYILIENDMNGREAIPEYCCTCIVGRRTVGCCAHVMTIVWYLGWARYQDNINPPAAFLDYVVIREDMDY